MKFRYCLLVLALLWLANAPTPAQNPVPEAQDAAAAGTDGPAAVPTDVPGAVPADGATAAAAAGPDAAAADGSPGAAAATPADRPPENWFEARLAIQDLADAADFDAAIALGDRLLVLAEREFGPDSRGLAEAHLLLAGVLRLSGDFEAAEQEILTAIDLLELAEGPLSTTLIDPFVELGDTYEAAGDFANAISAYDEARYIGRRNFGLLNEGQLELIDAMSEAADQLGQLEDAMDLQIERLTLIERIHGETSREALEARFTLALWFRAHNQFEEERRLYYQMARTIEEHHGDDPLLQVRSLRERAASFRAENLADPAGLAGLRDALEILEEMTDPPPLVYAQVLTDIGDWLVEFSRSGAIGDEYLQAWHLLGRVENGEALRKAWFEDLNEIQLSSLSRRDLSTDPADPAGYVVVQFTVDTRGRTLDIEITDSSPAGFKDAAVARLIRDARFRPRIIDGEILPMRRAYRFEFRYLPTAIESQ